jgi:hypothetical protein
MRHGHRWGALAVCGALLLAGCPATVTQLKTAEPIGEPECDVTLHSSEASAKAWGPIEELCVIDGTSSGSFTHTIETAVNKHKHRACECGATDVYIQSYRSGRKLTTASVTMVGFRYTGKGAEAEHKTRDKDKKEALRKARECQKEGGVWLDGKCETEIE